MLNNVIKGVPQTATTVFIDTDVLIFNTPPKWIIFDYSNNQILSGNAFQNIDHPEQWICVFTIPDEAPVNPDGHYSLVWLADVNGVKYKNTDTFTVLEEGEPPTFDSSSVMLPSDVFTDTIILPQGCSDFSISLSTDNDKILLSDSETSHFTSRSLNSNTLVGYNSNVVIPQIQKQTVTIGAYPFLVTWKYSLPTIPRNTEFHMVYVATSKTVLYIAALKRLMDKARNYDIDPNLRFTDQELCCFLLMGLSRLNSYTPVLTNYTLQNLPKALEYPLLKCAEYEALSAWALAEGMSAFSFTGASTSLEVDRSSHIKEKMADVGRYLDENVSKIKDNLVRSSSVGVLSITVSQSTNSQLRIPNSWLLSRLFRNQFIA